MVLTSFGYTWLDQFNNTVTATGALDSVNHTRQYNWRPSQRLFGDEGKEALDAVELQDHRPLHLPLGGRLLGFLEGAERPAVGPQLEHHVPW